MPRAGLTTLRVVQEAEELADDCGLDKLTLAAIATRLGVRMPSLYKHVAGMAALQRLVSIRAKTELADRLARAAAGKAGASAMIAVAHTYRDWAKEHPGRYAAILRSPDPEDHENSDASQALLDIVLASIASFDLHDDTAVDAVVSLWSGLHGFVNLELHHAFGRPDIDIDRSFDLVVAAIVQGLASWPPASHADPAAA